MLRGVELYESCTGLIVKQAKKPRRETKIERTIEEKLIQKTAYYKETHRKTIVEVSEFPLLSGAHDTNDSIFS